MFLIAVQAGTLVGDESEVRGGLTYEREGGQLSSLVKIPGA